MKKYNNSYYLIFLREKSTNEIIKLERNLLLKKLRVSEKIIDTLIVGSIKILEYRSYPSCLRYFSNFPDDYDERRDIEKRLNFLFNNYKNKIPNYEINLFEIPRIIYDLLVIYVYSKYLENKNNISERTTLYNLLNNNPIGNNLKGYPSVEPKIRYIEANIKKEKEKQNFSNRRDEINTEDLFEFFFEVFNGRLPEYVKARTIGDIGDILSSSFSNSVEKEKNIMEILMKDNITRVQREEILDIISKFLKNYGSQYKNKKSESRIKKLESDLKGLDKYKLDNFSDYKQVATEIFDNNIATLIELNYKMVDLLLELNISNYDFGDNPYGDWEEILLNIIKKFKEIDFNKVYNSSNRIPNLEIHKTLGYIETLEADIELFKEVLYAETRSSISDKILLYRGGETIFDGVTPLKYDAHVFYNNEIIMLPENVEPWDKDEKGFIYLIKNPTNRSNPENKYFRFYSNTPYMGYDFKQKGFTFERDTTYIFSRTYKDKVDPRAPLVNKSKPKSFSYNLSIFNGIFFDKDACTYDYMKKHQGKKKGDFNYKVVIKKPYYNQISEESKKKKLDRIRCVVSRNCQLKTRDVDNYIKLSKMYSLYLQDKIKIKDFTKSLKKFYDILGNPIGGLSINDRIISDINEQPTNPKLIELKLVLEKIKKEHELSVVPSLKKILDDRFVMDNLFFIPPLSPIFQLMGVGELWHVRTKLYKNSYQPFIDNYRNFGYTNYLGLHETYGSNYNKIVHYKVPQYLISDLGLQETIEISEALYKYNRINMLNRESNFKGKTEATHQRISVAEIFGGGKLKFNIISLK